MKTLCRLVVAVLVFTIPVVRSYPAPMTSASKVKITAESSKPDADGKQTVTLNLDIDKGWHVYANPVDNATWANNKTVVNIKAAKALKDVKIEYPAGKVEKESGDCKIYEDKVTIKAYIVRAPGDDSPLDVSVTVNACNKDTCLVPGAAKLTVK